MESLAGKVCRASNGDLGVVCHKHGEWYYGVGINGGAWRSRNPVVVSNTVAQFISHFLTHPDDGIVLKIVDDHEM